jgi:hypothetical protein
MPPSLQSLLLNFNINPTLEAISMRLSSSPLIVSAQIGVVLGAAFLIFLIFYATRDVLLRSRSLTMQVFSILLVAALPVVGFLLYLLIRPARTVWERRMEETVNGLCQSLQLQRSLLESVQNSMEAGKAKVPAMKVKAMKIQRKKQIAQQASLA